MDTQYNFYDKLKVEAKPYDIVWCVFTAAPHVPEAPEVQPRPGLVLRTYSLKQQFPYITVAYSASVPNDTQGSPQALMPGLPNPVFLVEHPKDIEAAGLEMPMVFYLEDHVELPWATDFFPHKPGTKSPVLGHLSPDSRRRLLLQSREAPWNRT